MRLLYCIQVLQKHYLEMYQKRILALMDQIPYKDRLAKRLAWAADAFLVDRESTGLKTILLIHPRPCEFHKPFLFDNM